MEIVKAGIKPEDIIHQGACLHCGTVVRFQGKEGRITEDPQDGSVISVQCPICGRNIRVLLSAPAGQVAKRGRSGR